MSKERGQYGYVNNREVCTGTSPYIYPNGLQQVKRTLDVKALDGLGTEVRLT